MLKSTSRLLHITYKPSTKLALTRSQHHSFSSSGVKVAAAAAAVAKPKMDEYKKVGNRANTPPKHEMVHFAGLLSEKRSFGDFRTVLHTGLYSA